MKLTSSEIFRYRLPLIKPLFLRGKKIAGRQGFILKLIFDKYIQGFGEIAPLPGVSLAGVNQCLQNLRQHLCKGGISDSLQRLDNPGLYPEVKFGIEMAVLNALAVKKQMTLNNLLSPDAANKVTINGLLLDSNNSWKREVSGLLDNGYKLIKVKVSGNINKDIRRITDLMKLINSRAQVHVDANRKWTFDEAVFFARKMKRYKIKYIEEPFSDIGRIPEFFRETGMPVALDESFICCELDCSIIPQGVKFLVLKPTLLGGIRKTLRIMKQADNKGVKPIISSSFESDIGILTLANLAATGGSAATAGLDTLKTFKNTLLKKPLIVSDGKILIPDINISETDIRREYLTPV